MSGGAQMLLWAVAYWLLAGACLLAVVFVGAGPLPYIAGFLVLFGGGWMVGGLYYLTR